MWGDAMCVPPFFSSVFPSQQGVHFARQKEWEKRCCVQA